MIKEERREERRKKRRRKSILLTILITLLLFITVAIVVVKVFTVKNVTVEGNVLYDSKMIEDTVLNDEYSWNTLYVYLKYRFVETEKIPFIDTMEISMTDPHSLSITVYEKGIMGYIYIPTINENAYFDKDGFVVETSSEIIADTPRIEGISCDEVVLYEKLPIKKSKLKNILTLTQTLKRAGLIPETIQYGTDGEPVIVYGGVEIRLGSMTDLTQKVARIEEILPHLENKSGVLHLEKWTEDSANIVFEEEK